MGSFTRLEDVQARLDSTEKEAEEARKESKKARDEFNDIKKLRYVSSGFNGRLMGFERHFRRCDLFNKAFTHISGRIDQIYKDLTKGKAAPMGGVAYLSLEDNEASDDLVLFMSGAVLTSIRRSPMPPASNITPCRL